MPLKSSVSSALGLVLVTATAIGAFAFQWVPGKKLLLGCSADETTAIRLFYNNESDYFHFPLIFRAVEQRDPRLNTAPMVAEGRTVYISQTEMQSLLRGLAQLDLPWQESKKVETLGSFKRLRPWSDSMEILVACSKGTARVKVDPKKSLRDTQAAGLRAQDTSGSLGISEVSFELWLSSFGISIWCISQPLSVMHFARTSSCVSSVTLSIERDPSPWQARALKFRRRERAGFAFDA